MEILQFKGKMGSKGASNLHAMLFLDLVMSMIDVDLTQVVHVKHKTIVLSTKVKICGTFYL